METAVDNTISGIVSKYNKAIFEGKHADVCISSELFSLILAKNHHCVIAYNDGTHTLCGINISITYSDKPWYSINGEKVNVI